MQYITDEMNEKYPLKPDDIDTTGVFWDSFGNMETEASALWLVRYCQSVKSWAPFKLSDLQAFYEQTCKEQFWFNRLTGIYQGGVPEYYDVYVKAEDDLVTLSHEFIAICFKSSPKIIS